MTIDEHIARLRTIGGRKPKDTDQIIFDTRLGHCHVGLGEYHGLGETYEQALETLYGFMVKKWRAGGTK